MSKRTITRAEDAALIQFVRWSISSRGYAPTYREIGQKLGLASTQTVSTRVARLTDRGYLTRVHGQPRTLQTTPDGLEFAIANS